MCIHKAYCRLDGCRVCGRKGRGFEGSGTGRVSYCGCEFEGIQEDIEALVVVHVVVLCLRSIRIGPHIRVTSVVSLVRPIPEFQALLGNVVRSVRQIQDQRHCRGG